MLQSSKGFTLIEILATIAIVGILSGIIFINFQNSVYESNLAKARAFAVSVPLSLPTSFLAEWKFDGSTAANSAATLSDLSDSWGGFSASSVSGVKVLGKESCMLGKCLSFNGTSDKVSSSSTVPIINSKANWTLSAWIKPDTDGGKDCFFSEGNGTATAFSACVSIDDYVVVSMYRGSALEEISTSQSGKKINRGKWNYVVISLKDGETSGTLNFWLNGEPMLTLSGQVKTSYPSINVQNIGANCNGDYFKGSIDDIQAYNDFITATSVASAPVRQVSSISITSSPTVITYSVGDAIDTSNLAVTANYNVDPMSVAVPLANLTFGFDTTTPAAGRAVSISYEGKATSYNIDVFPKDPTGFGCSSSLPTSVTCVWTPGNGSSTGNTAYKIKEAGGNISSFSTAPGLIAGTCNTSYSYMIKACAGSSETVCSNYSTPAVSATTSACAPTAPTTLAFSGTTATATTATWSGATGTITNYDLDISTSSSYAITTNIYSGTALTAPSSSLTCATTYYYRVRACNAGGCSSWFNASNTTGSCPVQTTPTFNPAAGAVASGTTVTISSAGADAIYYTINGDTPTTSSTNQTTTPLVISAGMTVKALAVKSGYTNSDIGSATYTLTYFSTCSAATNAQVNCTPIPMGTSEEACKCTYLSGAGQTTWTVPSTVTQVQYLVIGGGGGGGNTGAGGGAGGYRYHSSFPILPGSYNLTVGSGGAGGSTSGGAGAKGSPSIFSTITAEGGGYGASHYGNGGTGGSGGGGGMTNTSPTPTGGSGNQGSAGGAGYYESGFNGNNGGGGGAGGAGVSAGPSANSGDGGVGLLNSISGADVYYAGGGAGADVNSGSSAVGGTGGGGNATLNSVGSDGGNGLGGGGGGGAFTGSYLNGGAGGSGVVIIRYSFGTASLGSSTNPGASCLAIKNAGISTSGLYWINPSNTAFQVYCDMVTDGGGWVLVAKFNSLAVANMFTSTEISTSHGDINTPNDAKYMLRTTVQSFTERNAKVNGTFMKKVTSSASPIFGTANWVSIAEFTNNPGHNLIIRNDLNEYWGGWGFSYPQGSNLTATTTFSPFNKAVPDAAFGDYCSFSGGGVTGGAMGVGFGCRTGALTWSTYSSSEYVEIYGR